MLRKYNAWCLLDWVWKTGCQRYGKKWSLIILGMKILWTEDTRWSKLDKDQLETWTQVHFLYYLGVTQVHQSFRKQWWPYLGGKGALEGLLGAAGGRELERALAREDGAQLVLCDQCRKELISKGASKRNWYLLEVKPAELMDPALSLNSGEDPLSWQLPSPCYVWGTRDLV